MQNLPHHYAVKATTTNDTHVDIGSSGLDSIESAPPAEFGGPGDRWSPETLLVAAVADCFLLTFKAIARVSKLDWVSLSCEVDGILDRVEKVTQFTEFVLHALIEVPEGTDEQKTRRLLEKSEQACLITNSLRAVTHLNVEVRISTTLGTG
ncbi:MAG: OsmC family protein [Gammaproteobacteria bacterium]|nr:OsmC family protein [Gammaproteobacteria bacterium]